MIYKIEIYDSEDITKLADIVDQRAYNIRWGFAPVGGCAQVSFTVPSRYCTETIVAIGNNVRIKCRNSVTKDYDLYYQGRIESVSYSPMRGKETITISGFGYQSQLKDIIITEDFTGIELSAIVKNILDNYIAISTNTDITYDLADIESTGFTPSGTISFDSVTAMDAISDLADIAGNVDWGVDRNRKFYFKQRSTSVTDKIYIGSPELLDLRINATSIGLLTRAVVRGEGTFVYTKDYTKSQAKYKRRDIAISRSSVSSNDIAEQLADAEYAKRKDPIRRAEYTLKRDALIENTLPIGLVDIESRETTYDEKEFDTFLFADPDPYRINQVEYSIDKTSNLVIKINAGDAIPSDSEKIRRLEFELNQVRNK